MVTSSGKVTLLISIFRFSYAYMIMGQIFAKKTQIVALKHLVLYEHWTKGENSNIMGMPSKGLKWFESWSICCLKKDLPQLILIMTWT